ncbi:MAG TPA: uroporphyrinogen-III synthase [Pseudomonadales bacterium]
MSRSQPGADRQAAELRAAGHRVVVAPVLAIEALQPPLPAGDFDLVLFLSEHAVRFGLTAIAELSWFGAARVLAVGARTAERLAERGVDPEVPAEPTSEGLLALPTLERVAGRRVLLVAGEGGRSLLAETLTARGAEVVRYECYRRVALDRLDPAVLDCDVLIAASGDGLEQAARLWRAHGGRDDLAVLVPSARVAALGVELGFVNLHDCAGADSAAWLRGLAELQSSSA